MDRNITSISYSLTTHCNMRCPNCCAGITAMPKEKKSFVSWKQLEESAIYFKGIDRINLTGGEPSIHPKFEEFVPKLKELFECRLLSIWTNGTMFQKKPEVWKYFDQIHITNYTEKTFEGSPNNTESIKWIREKLKDTKVEIFDCETVHIPLTQRGTKMCFRGYSDTVEFVNGKIYPCCAGSGLDTQIYLPLQSDWKEKILTIHPPCEECLFAEN